MGMKPLKFDFPVEDFTVKSSGFHYNGKFYLNSVKVLIDEQDITQSIDLSFLISFEHLAVEHANESFKADVG